MCGFMDVLMSGRLTKLAYFQNGMGVQTFFSKAYGSLTGLKPTLSYFPLGLVLAVYTVLIASARAGIYFVIKGIRY